MTTDLIITDSQRGIVLEVGKQYGVELKLSPAQDAIALITGPSVIRSDVYPDYDGAYVVTPGPEEQILETKYRTTLENIRIGPIPNNYGLITYNGHTITVS